MLSPADFNARLTQEAADIQKEEKTFKPVNGDITHWRGFIVASSGPYKGGVYYIDIKVPREYPFKPPKVEWKTPIFHPNIFGEEVCLEILKKGWTAAYNLLAIIQGLRFLLSNPNPDDPLHIAAGNLMKKDYSTFEQKVIELKKKATFKQVIS